LTPRHEARVAAAAREREFHCGWQIREDTYQARTLEMDDVVVHSHESSTTGIEVIES